MLILQPQEFRLPIQQSGTNVTVSLPADLRRLFGMEKGDTLILRYDPAAASPLLIVDLEKAPASPPGA